MPQNGFEMLHFFYEAMQIANPIHGYSVLSNGDVVVMDNCRFHHGRFAEAELRHILQVHGVNLVFQPPYSPEFKHL